MLTAPEIEGRSGVGASSVGTDRAGRSRAKFEAGVGIRFLRRIAGEFPCEVGVHHGLGIEDELSKGLDSHECAGRDKAVGDG